MGFARRQEPRPQSGNKPDYRTSFVTRFHAIVSMGYVQQGTLKAHAEALAKELQADRETYRVAERGEWTEFQVVKMLSTFRSIHKRSDPLPRIVVLHTLLLFC
ncbi:MAG: hypothetical protein ACLQNE_36445 [Thermoguttaceae bacterium]